MADVTAAMSVEAMLGTDRTFQAELHEIRPHAGQVASAANLCRLLRGSGIVASHRDDSHACGPGRVFDALQPAGRRRRPRHARLRPPRRRPSSWPR